LVIFAQALKLAIVWQSHRVRREGIAGEQYAKAIEN
jgi:hypothetical protein